MERKFPTVQGMINLCPTKNILYWYCIKLNVISSMFTCFCFSFFNVSFIFVILTIRFEIRSHCAITFGDMVHNNPQDGH